MRASHSELPGDRIARLDQERDVHHAKIRNGRTKLLGEPLDESKAAGILFNLRNDAEQDDTWNWSVKTAMMISVLERNMASSTRSIPISLAPVLEHLELEQPEVITLKQLEDIARDAGVRTSPALIAHRLLALGWLLRTGLNGTWEFAPAAHAGPLTRGGLLMPVKAALALAPDLPAALAMTSAAWAFGFADRAPPRIELAVMPGTAVAAGLARMVKILRFDTRLKPVDRKGVPVQRVESVLVHMAARPSHVTSWGEVAEWIGDLVAEASEADVQLELTGRPRAVRVRLAYLLQALWPKLAEQIGGGGTSKVWFGPRKKLRRHSQRWLVADTILPFDPAKLPQVRRT